jgi:hypothetical protein
MSENGDSSDDDGLEELFDKARISEKGLLKLSTHEVMDQRMLLLLSTSEISALKLAVADKARLVNLINLLQPKPDSPVKEKPADGVTSNSSQAPAILASTDSTICFNIQTHLYYLHPYDTIISNLF